MFFRLLAVFIVLPLVELTLLLRLADATSWLTTLGLVVATGILGTLLASREGVAAWLRFQTALASGRVPSSEIQDGLMIAIAALLLLTPGLLTDALGFALLTPVGRRWIGGIVRRRLGGSVQFHASNGKAAAGENPPSAFDENRSGNGRWTIDSPNFGPKA